MLAKLKILFLILLFIGISCQKETKPINQNSPSKASLLFEKGKKADDISQKLSFYRLASKEVQVSDTILPYLLDQ